MPTEKQHLFDNPQNVRRILWLLYLACTLLLALDFIVHRHLVHRWEGLLGFYAIYGFIGCVVLVLIAQWMRTFLMRDATYYDQEEPMTAPRDGGDHVGN